MIIVCDSRRKLDLFITTLMGGLVAHQLCESSMPKPSHLFVGIPQKINYMSVARPSFIA